jgi:hypothetical protein
MYSRWFNAAVVVLWLSAMGWLVMAKVLPPLLVGTPPSYDTILQAQRGEPPVGWRMIFNGKELGWALSTASALPDRMTEVRSWVHFDRIPLEDLTPDWLRALVPLPVEPIGNLEMDARNTMLVDPLGRLASFQSEVRVSPLKTLVKMSGEIVGNKLKYTIHTGDLPYEDEVRIPQDALLSDVLSPQTQLPGIRPGQTWTVPVYSPLRPPGNPLEILQATVQDTEPIRWNGRTAETLVVVYASDSGSRLGRRQRPRGKLWVRPDGTVLKQQVMIFNSTMTFVRLRDDQAAALERRVSPDWDESPPR